MMPTDLFAFRKSRFALLLPVATAALAAFSLLRLTLLLREWPLTEPTAARLAYVFAMGLVYDAAFLSYAAMPAILLLAVLPTRWYQCRFFRLSWQSGVLVTLFLLLFIMVAEWLFWDEFGVRFNFIAVDYLVYRREVTNNIIESYPLPALLGAIFSLSVLLFFSLRNHLYRAWENNDQTSSRLARATILLLLAVFAFAGLDQTQRTLSDNNYVNELAANGPYQFFAAFRNNTLDYRTFYALGEDLLLSDELKTAVQEPDSTFPRDGIYDIRRTIKDEYPARTDNVILISVESLSAGYLSRFGNTKHLTPFLDHLLGQGMLFTNFYATGTRTDRGLEAITLSLPPTPGRSMVKRPDNSGMYSLGKVFIDHGYDTVFLYGGRGYFDNMNAFFAGNGYRIVDQGALKDDEITFANAWGVADEDLYRRAIHEADIDHAAGKPFFFHIMTTSNHRPYTYPEGKIDIPSGTGRAGAVKYTDYALERLLAEAQNRPWFADTIFVLVADHCAGSAGKVGLPVDKYQIPFFIYAPGRVMPEEISTMASQIDVAPTLLGLLHFSYESFFFGRNILEPGFQPRALIGNYQKLGLVQGNELLILSPQQKIERIDLTDEPPAIAEVPPSYPPVMKVMSFYQGADYVLRNRLNRWQREKGGG